MFRVVATILKVAAMFIVAIMFRVATTMLEVATMFRVVEIVVRSCNNCVGVATVGTKILLLVISCSAQQHVWHIVFAD